MRPDVTNSTDQDLPKVAASKDLKPMRLKRFHFSVQDYQDNLGIVVVVFAYTPEDAIDLANDILDEQTSEDNGEKLTAPGIGYITFYRNGRPFTLGDIDDVEEMPETRV